MNKNSWRNSGLNLALVASLVFVSVLPVPAWAANAKATKYYDDAAARFAKKDFAGANVQLKNALQADSNFLQARILLGKTLVRLGDVAAADVTLSDTLTLGAKRVDVVVPLAHAYIAQGKQKLILANDLFSPEGLPPKLKLEMMLIYAACKLDLDDPKGALKQIELARAFNPKSTDTWLAEVPVRLRMHQFKEANEAVEKAGLLAPDAPETLYQKAAVLHVAGNLPAAITAYERTVKASPQHAEARLALAGLFIDTGRRAEAAVHLVELQTLTPEDPRAAYLRALLAEYDKKPEVAQEALREITEIIDKFPIDFIRYRPQILMLNGLAHFGLNEPEKARKYFEVFQKTQGSSPTAKPLAQIYLRSASYDLAIDVLQVYLKANPGDGQAMALLGSAMIGKGQFARAEALMQTALQSKDVPEFHTVLGMSMLRGGQTANGIKELEGALKKDPTLTPVATTLIPLYLRNGQTAKAVLLAENLTKQQPKSAGLMNLLGMVRTNARNPDGAKAAFEESIRLDPKFTLPKLNLARIEIGEKAYDKATLRLNEVLKAEPKNAEAIFELASIANRKGQSPETQRWLESAASLAGPRETRWGLALSDFYLQTGQAAKALEAAKQTSAKAPEELQVLMALAKAQLASGDTANLKSSLVTATRLADYAPAPQVQIALLQLASGNTSGASYSLDKALTTQPDFLPALALMTEVEIRQGDLVKADKRARAIIAKHPKQAVGYGLLGDIALAKGKVDIAVDEFRKAHQAEPTTDSLLRQYRLLRQTSPKQADQLVELWLKGHPKDAKVHNAVGDSQARAGNFAAARVAYESALALSPTNPQVLNNLANVLMRLKDPTAVGIAEKATAQNPVDANLADTLGWALFQNGQADRALQVLQNARTLDTKNSDVRYHLAVVLAQKGNKAEARQELETALKNERPFESKTDAAALLKTLS